MSQSRSILKHLSSGALATALAILGTAAPASADDVLAKLERPSNIAAGNGVIAYSAYDPAIKAYRLTTITDGRTEVLAIDPSPAAFDVDVGETSSGHALLVYSRCESDRRPVAKGCDLYVYNPATGKEQRSKASSPKHSEVAPTYWHGRLAFVRYYGSDKHRKAIVYQRPNARTRRSQRLPGIPARRCPGGRCTRVSGTVDELELRGNRLAEVLFTVTPTPQSHGATYDAQQTEVRLVDVKRGRSAQVDRHGSGESGQQFVQPSFDAGKLYSYFQCSGDPSGCNGGIAGPYAYDYTDDSVAHSSATPLIGGFAVDAGETYEVPIKRFFGCGQGEPGVPTPQNVCGLVRKDPAPTYKPTRTRR